jgi:hypothetical protein
MVETRGTKMAHCSN